MTQAQKRDAILQHLYKFRFDDSMDFMLKSLMQELGIYEGDQEVNRIAKRLKEDGLIGGIVSEEGDARIFEITDKGVDYCEGTSYSAPGTAVVNLTINGNVTGSNIGAAGNNSQIVQTSVASTKEAEYLIKVIREELQKSFELDEEKKDLLIDCVDDIEESIKAQKPVRRFKWSILLDNLGKSIDIGPKIYKLIELVNSYSETTPT